jgi:hypothetical protein
MNVKGSKVVESSDHKVLTKEVAAKDVAAKELAAEVAEDEEKSGNGRRRRRRNQHRLAGLGNAKIAPMRTGAKPLPT